MKDENKDYQGVKIQKIPTRGRPLSYKSSKWKPQLNVSNEDLKALSKVIRKADKEGKK